MLSACKIVSFVATTNPLRAKSFYADTLGLKLISEDRYALVFDAAGTTLRVSVVQLLRPVEYTVLGWIVSDIEEAVRDLLQRGIAPRRYEGLGQDDQGVWAAPGGAKIVWFQDPDGNTLSLSQL